MNLEQREKLMFEIRNRLADIEVIVYETLRAMREIKRVLDVVNEHLTKFIDETDVYEKSIDLLKKFDIDEEEFNNKNVRVCRK
jgi:hypothetical protein